MSNFFKFVLGLLFLLISFLVTPITTTIILGLFFIWCLGWLVIFLIVIIRRLKSEWIQAKAEIKAEDEAWDDLLATYWNTEYSDYLIAARTAGWSPTVASMTVRKNEEAHKAENDAEIEKIHALDARENAIEREKKIAYWIARHASRKRGTQ